MTKGKSTVAVLQPGGTVVRKPFDVKHSSCELKNLTDYILTLDGETKAVMECTGRYHEPILRALSDAGIFVSAVNPHLKRSEGKPYHVYMTAGANKFLRIYYGKVKECLRTQSETEN